MRKVLIGCGIGVLVVVAVRAADPAPIDANAGKKVMTGKCARCHRLYEPMKYDGKAWDNWMTKMREKAKLNDQQFEQLTAYVQTLRTTTH